MNELKILIIGMFLIPSNLILSQENYPMSFFIIDKGTGNPIENAKVSVKEIGYQSESSGVDGKAYFSSLPVGEINYFITLDGYNGVDGVFNITSETKSNTLRVKLAKIPPKRAAKVLISGEVVDEQGKDIRGVEIELKAGRKRQKTLSDESGNFDIEFDLSQIQYAVTEFRLEAKKNECKFKESIPIPKNNYIYKEIKLKCISDSEQNEPGESSNYGQTKIIGKEWKFQLKSCNRTGEGVRCYFTVENLNNDGNFIIGTSSSTLFDSYGKSYNGSRLNAQLGTYRSGGGFPSFGGKLVRGIPTEGSMIFLNVDKRASKITLIEFPIRADNVPRQVIQFRNIKIQ